MGTDGAAVDASAAEPPALPSRLVLGTARLSLRATPRPRSVYGPQAFALLDRAFEVGIRAFDTAAIYQLGGSERAIGEWLRRTGNRDRVCLIGKGGHPSIVLGRSRLGRGDLERDLQASLRRLRTERLDFYLLHWDAPEAPLEPLAETLWSFVASGRVRAYGVSNWTHERFAALRALAVSRGMPPPAASSPQFSLPQWVAKPYRYTGSVSLGVPDRAVALHAYRAAGAAVLAWSPLGSGWLRAPGRRARNRAYQGAANDARLVRLHALAERIGCTPAQAALAYVLAHGSNVHAIVGTRRPQRLAELQAAAALTLDPEQVAWLVDGRGPSASGPSMRSRPLRAVGARPGARGVKTHPFDDRRLPLPHRTDFVDAWRSVRCSVYRWRQAGRFAVVPSLAGRPVYAYVPGLDYSDLDASAAEELAREIPNRRFNIRALTAPRPEGELEPDAPVTMRIDLAAFGRAPEAVWERGLNRAARKAVRRARKAGLAVAEETGPGAMQAIYVMLRLANARHGAPMPPLVLIEAMVTELGARILVTRDRASGDVRAGLLWVRSGPIALVPYSGAYHSADCPGNLLFWAAVEQAAHDGADILDFGRSPAGSGAYRFKRNFGASPIPILWLSDKPVGPYRRYRVAQSLWRALPDSITDRAGPRLCRYLADY